MDSLVEQQSQIHKLTSRWLVVGVFTLAYALTYVDRQVLTLLVDPIRHSFGLSDTQIGLLQGFAFALCFAIGGVPLGWLVDNTNRVRVAAGCIALWSGATVSTGLVTGYLQLLAARSFTALTEAGCTPAAISIFADIFPPRLLPRASAIYTAAPIVGGAAALFAGGFALRHFTATGGLDLAGLGHLAPWQAVFVVVGAPGFILALLALILVREPLRREGDRSAAETITFAETLRFIGRDSRYLPAYFAAYAFILAAFFSLITWYPTFTLRSAFGSAASMGRTLGLIFLGCGLAGAIGAQWVVGRVRDAEVVLRVMRRACWVLALQIPLAPLLGIAGLPGLSLFSYGALIFLISTLTSMMPIPLQVGVPNRMRGRVIGLFILAVNLIGTGLGPVAVGAVSDRLGNTPHALAGALLGVLLLCAVAGFGLMKIAANRLQSRLAAQSQPSF